MLSKLKVKKRGLLDDIKSVAGRPTRMRHGYGKGPSAETLKKKLRIMNYEKGFI